MDSSDYYKKFIDWARQVDNANSNMSNSQNDTDEEDKSGLAIWFGDSTIDWDGLNNDIADALEPRKPEYLSRCNHKWIDYTGLHEKFQFCEKCDKKRKYYE